MSEPTGDPADVDSAQPIVLGEVPPEPSGPPRNRRTRKIVLAVLLAVVLAGAVVLGVAGWRVGSQKDAKLTVPAQIGSLALDSSEDGKSTADYLTTALSAEMDLDKTVGAVYRDQGAPAKSVLFFGGTALIWSPSDDLDSAFNLVADDQGAVKDIHDVDAGKLGGSMKCGNTATADGDLMVCGWADHGSLAVALFPGRAEAEAAPLLRRLRDATESRS